MGKSSFFSREHVLLFGFLSGLWIAVGIDPEAIIFDSLLNLIKIYNPDFKVGFMFYLLPILGIIYSVIDAYILTLTVSTIFNFILVDK